MSTQFEKSVLGHPTKAKTMAICLHAKVLNLRILIPIYIYTAVLLFIKPLQINFLFPVLTSTIFACGWAVHFHYFIIRLAAFAAIICLVQLHKSY